MDTELSEPTIEAPEKKGRFAKLNSEIAKAFHRPDPAPAVGALRSAFLAIYDDGSHPLRAELILGRKHWYDKDFGLNDIALDCGRRALRKRDMRAARQIARFVAATGFLGPATVRFLADCSAVDGDWKAARGHYGRLRTPPDDPSASPAEWERRERIFHRLGRLLRTASIDWIDLSPIRSTGARLQALDGWWRAILADGRIGAPEFTPILAEIAKLKRKPAAFPPASPAAADVSAFGIRNFRNYLAGKSVCLVANSRKARETPLGAEIDGYDVVIRFDDFVLSPANTGEKTSVHALLHTCAANRDTPVDLRIVMASRRETWASSVHDDIRPGMQKHLADSSLMWPAVALGAVDPEGEPRSPTAELHMLSVLVHFRVTRTIDLFGFDLDGDELLGADDAGVTSPESRLAEAEWILSRATSRSDAVVSLQ